jgi:hypothetical protein
MAIPPRPERHGGIIRSQPPSTERGSYPDFFGMRSAFEEFLAQTINPFSHPRFLQD